MKTQNPFWSLAVLSVLAFEFVPSGCSTSSAPGAGGGQGGGGGALSGNAGNSGTTGANDSGGYDGPTLGVDGSGKIPIGQTQCSDGIDNDGDGLIDYADPECVGPLDNDESSFATGIPGDNMDACKQDCFFDGNSGMGDDHCLWQLKCDPLSNNASCPYDSAYASSHTTECSLSASQSQACIDACRKLVPNGCDCFGCCQIPGAPNAIRLAPTCTAAKFNDPVACPPCTQVTQCANTCEHCEICIGKPTLPADCGPVVVDAGTNKDAGTPPPPPPVCPGTSQACGPGGIDPTACPAGTGCITGCCLNLIP
jgi:hypothetical protein